MQLAETFSTPSPNQRMCRSFASKETSLTSVNGVIQSSRRAASAKKPSGSRAARSRSAA